MNTSVAAKPSVPSFVVAPFLPMSRAEMTALGCDSCDVILVAGDAYINHPSFGMALAGRLLEAQGFRVGIVAQPDRRSAEAFGALGEPNLFFGVTAGKMDSMATATPRSARSVPTMPTRRAARRTSGPTARSPSMRSAAARPLTGCRW